MELNSCIQIARIINSKLIKKADIYVNFTALSKKMKILENSSSVKLSLFILGTFSLTVFCNNLLNMYFSLQRV